MDNFELKNVVSQSNLLLLGRGNLKIPLYPPFSKGEIGEPFSKGEIGEPFSKGEIGEPFSKGEIGEPFSKGKLKSHFFQRGDS